jgi:hypothetical protein
MYLIEMKADQNLIAGNSISFSPPISLTGQGSEDQD